MNVTPHAVSGRRSRPGSVRPAEHELMRAAVPRVPFYGAGSSLPADIFSKVPITDRKNAIHEDFSFIL